MTLKILAILMLLTPMGCATTFDTGRDMEIIVTSSNAQTKFYHNGRFIGIGKRATTYASGYGTDVLSGVQKGCVISQQNVKKEISPAFIGGNILSALLLGVLVGVILDSNTSDTTNDTTDDNLPIENSIEETSNSINSAIGIFVGGVVANSVLSIGLITDAASGSWRRVAKTEYNLTPQCEVQK